MKSLLKRINGNLELKEESKEVFGKIEDMSLTNEPSLRENTIDSST